MPNTSPLLSIAYQPTGNPAQKRTAIMAILNIAITKAGNKAIAVETDELPEDMYALALKEGLKVLLNKGMSKITTAKLEGEQLESARAAAYEKGLANFEDLKAGKVKVGRAAATTADGKKVSGVVMTEARRLAKEIVKNELRSAGVKISHVEASQITKAANALIEADPSLIETATANIEARTAKHAAIDVASLVQVSPKLVAKAEAEKATRKSQLSAKQAGKVAPRKGQQSAAN